MAFTSRRERAFLSPYLHRKQGCCSARHAIGGPHKSDIRRPSPSSAVGCVTKGPARVLCCQWDETCIAAASLPWIRSLFAAVWSSPAPGFVSNRRICVAHSRKPFSRALEVGLGNPCPIPIAEHPGPEMSSGSFLLLQIPCYGDLSVLLFSGRICTIKGYSGDGCHRGYLM